MKLWTSVAGAVLVLAGCSRRQPITFDRVEGGGPSAQPPLVRAARVEDPALRRLQRGRLVVQTAVAFRPTRAVVTISPTVASSAVLTDTTTMGVLESTALLPGEYLVRARRVGVVPQEARVQVRIGFADTVVFTLGRP